MNTAGIRPDVTSKTLPIRGASGRLEQLRRAGKSGRRTRNMNNHAHSISPWRDFLKSEATGAAALAAATVTALVLANSPLRDVYHRVLDRYLTVGAGDWAVQLTVHHWINDALMTIFFLVVGLEIKREIAVGQLSTRKRLALPFVAAIGGMAAPALIYLVVSRGEFVAGWGVPMATDIALAVGLLAALGARVSAGARVMLLGLAIVDDIGAIIVLAVFYSTGVSGSWLMVAASSLIAVVIARRLGMTAIPAYLVLGTLLWFALQKSGVHPTLAGVAMGLLAPVTPMSGTSLVDAEESGTSGSVSVVEWLQHIIHPWSSLLIVPLFALANAGVSLSLENIRTAISSPIAQGIFCGLVLGKPIGIALFVLLGRRASILEFPTGVSNQTVIGVGSVAGIGFTVAMFIAELAFDSPEMKQSATIAILAASLVSAIFGALALRLATHE